MPGNPEAGREGEAPRIVIVQPTVPSYRVPFFDRLHAAFGDAFRVYASRIDMGALTPRDRPVWEVRLPDSRRLPLGLSWQPGVLSIPLARGDVAVIWGAPRCLSNLALLARARLLGARTVWWGHYWSASSTAWRAALRRAVMRLSGYALLYTEREIAEWGLPPARRGHVGALNNGIETGEIARLRALYRAAARERRLLFIGRFSAKSELALLLEALARPDCAGLRLEVIGGGEDAPRHRHAAGALGLADRVTWHGEMTDERRIAAVANRCRMFVYPGGVGLSLIHAMAYGLPALLHDDRWAHMPEIAAFEEGGTGASFARGDATALARALARLIEDTDRLDRMSARALAVTAASFNAADMARRFCAMVEALGVGRTGAAGPVPRAAVERPEA